MPTTRDSLRLPLSIAASWLKRGQLAIARSFRFHRPRGAFCHRGWCQQCKVRLPDGRNVLACTTECSADDSQPRARRDWLRLLGRIAEGTRPWFYENQRLSGMWQQVFLESVRRASSALPIPALSTLEERRATRSRHCQTLVIGGGPAGMLAARALARAGRHCLVVQSGAPGGTARTLFAQGAHPWPVVDAVETAFQCLAHHLCVGIYENPRSALCVGPEGNVIVEFDTLVVATGAYDRIPTIEGNDVPGVVGLRAYERLVVQGAIDATWRVGLYGARGEVERAFSAAESARLRFAFVASPSPLPVSVPGGRSGVRLTRIAGGERITSVAFDDGTQAECDLLVVGFTQPTYEFQAQNGSTIELVGDPPIVRARPEGRTPMLVVGEAAGWIDAKDLADKIDQSVADWRAGRLPFASSDATPANPGTTVTPRAPDTAFVCFCEDVRVGDIRAAIADGYGDVELAKRHTGAGTGPCQGKRCHGALLACLREGGADARIPTPRPLLRPVALRQLAGGGSRSRTGAPHAPQGESHETTGSR